MTCPKCNTEHDPTRCSAHNGTGQQCGKAPLKGASVCRTHGGSAPQVKAAAAENLQQQAAEELLERLVFNVDAEPIRNPGDALQRIAGQLQQTVEVVGTRLNSTIVCPTCHRGPEPLDGPTARLWIAAVAQQRQLLTDMERTGIYSKQVEVEAEKVRMIAGALVRVFDALGLDAEQRALGQRVLFTELRAGEVVVAGEVSA